MSPAKGQKRGSPDKRNGRDGRGGHAIPNAGPVARKLAASLLSAGETLAARVPAPRRRPTLDEPILSTVVTVRDVWKRMGKYGREISATVMSLPRDVREVTGMHSGIRVLIRAYADGFTVERAPGVLSRREEDL